MQAEQDAQDHGLDGELGGDWVAGHVGLNARRAAPASWLVPWGDITRARDPRARPDRPRSEIRGPFGIRSIGEQVKSALAAALGPRLGYNSLVTGEQARAQERPRAVVDQFRS
jgi:hypothetical protein